MSTIVPKYAKIKVWKGLYAHWGMHLVGGLVIEKRMTEVAIRELDASFNPSDNYQFGVFCGNSVEKAAAIGILEDFTKSSQYNLLLNNCEKAATGFSEQSFSAVVLPTAVALQLRKALIQQPGRWFLEKTIPSAAVRSASLPIAAAGVGFKMGKHWIWDGFVKVQHWEYNIEEYRFCLGELLRLLKDEKFNQAYDYIQSDADNTARFQPYFES